jgi:hypothetical protein
VRIPPALLVHTVTVQPAAGESSTGQVYGDPFQLRCMAQGRRRMVRDSDGNEALSTLTLYAAPEDFDRITAGSQVTWHGGVSTVMAVVPHDSGGLGAPDHTEVVCE